MALTPSDEKKWTELNWMMTLLSSVKLLYTVIESNLAALTLLLNWTESTLNWLELNNDIAAFSRTANSWIELISK